MTIQRDWSTGLAAGSTGIAFIGYNGTTKSAGKFYGGTTAPSNTTRLNYDGNLYATTFYGSAAGLSNTTVPIASINATGTPSSTTFLRGDGQWVTVSVPVTSVGGYTGAVTAGNLLTAITTVDGAASGLDADLLDGQQGSYYAPADAGVSNVGAIIFAYGTPQFIGQGGTVAGSTLYPCCITNNETIWNGSLFGASYNPTARTGTWRCLGSGQGNGYVAATVWQRIA